MLAAAGGWLAGQPFINNHDIPGSPMAWTALACIWLAGAAALLGIISTSPQPADDEMHFPRLAPALALSAGLILLPAGFLWFPHGVWATLGTAPGYFFAISALITLAALLAALNPAFNRPGPASRILHVLIFLSSVLICGRILAAML